MCKRGGAGTAEDCGQAMEEEWREKGRGGEEKEDPGHRAKKEPCGRF